MALFPAVLTLENARVHVYSFDHSNITSYIKISVNEVFSISTVLRVPNINPYNSHIRLRWCLNNLRTRGQNYIVKDVSALNNTFDNI